MIVTPIDNLRIKLHSHALPPQSRAPGVHVSTILRSIALKIGKLHADDYTEPASEWGGLPVSSILRIAMGLAWEQWLMRGHIEDDEPESETKFVLWHVQSYCLDDIWGTPDGWCIAAMSDHEIAVPIAVRQDEIKLTWSSCNRPVQDRWLWLKQIMAYCWMAESHFGLPCRTARLLPLHINGDYNKSGGGFKPLFVPVALEFTEDELKKNWRMILNHRDLGVVEYGGG